MNKKTIGIDLNKIIDEQLNLEEQKIVEDMITRFSQEQFDGGVVTIDVYDLLKNIKPQSYKEDKAFNKMKKYIENEYNIDLSYIPLESYNEEIKVVDIIGMEGVRLATAMAFGKNEYLHKYIDEIYYKNEIDYYKYMKKNKYFEAKPFSKFTPLYSEYMKKCLGIIEFDIKNEIDKNIDYLTMKGYKIVWKEVKTARANKRNNDGNIFLDFSRIKNSVYHYYSDEEDIVYFNADMYFYVTTFYALKDNTSFVNLSPEFFKTFQTLFEYLKFPETLFEDNKEDAKDIPQDILYYYKVNFIDVMNEDLFLTEVLDDFIDTFFPEKQYENLNHYFVKEIQSSTEDISIKNGRVYSEKNINIYSKLLNIYDLAIKPIGQDLKLTKKEVRKISSNILNAIDGYNIDVEVLSSYRISALIIYALVKEIKAIENEYLDSLNKKHVERIIEIKEKLDKKREKLEEKEEKLTKKEKQYSENKKKIKELMKQNKKIIKENEGLKTRINNDERKEQELVALRTHFWNLEETDASNLSKDIDKIKDELKNKSILIVGGHPNWIKKMKEELPNIQYLEVNKTSDLSFIKNIEHIIINRDHNSHALYEKIITNLSENNKLSYISNITNIERSVYAIYKNID